MRPVAVVCLVGLAAVLPALAWDSRDVDAAEHYRQLEQERAERFRDQVANGRTARIEPGRSIELDGGGRIRERAEPKARDRRDDRTARREARRRDRTARESAWQRQVDRWTDQAEEWGGELGAQLGEAIEEAVRDAFEGRDRR